MARGTSSLGGGQIAAPFEVSEGDADSFVITVDDVVAQERSDWLDEFVVLLRSCDGVDAAHREDREVLVVSAPGLDEASVRALVANQWVHDTGGD